jgi:hypothetical protein
MLRPTVGAFLLTGFILLGSGCAAFPFLDFQQAKAVFPKPEAALPYQDFSGIIHVHTNYSKNSTGSYEEVARAAEKTHADFVIVTDHNTLGGFRENKDGLYGDVLILAGSELTTPGGHLAVMDIDKDIEVGREPAETVREAHAAGAVSFICHPELDRSPWSDWSLAGSVTGMEIYNLPTEAYEGGVFWFGLKSLFFPPHAFFRSFLGRPDDVLKRWDEILKDRRFVGIAAVDAHEKYRVFGKPLDSYAAMFKVAQTHVWARELSKKSIYEGLRAGHVYVGFDLVKPVRNFLFSAASGEEQALMGDMIKDREDLKLKVMVPEQAEIRILKDGVVWKTAKAGTFEVSAEGAGVYRVEIYRGKRLWILSNPIYVVKW